MRAALCSIPLAIAGMGTRCAEAQADGVPCAELRSDCETCDRARSPHDTHDALSSDRRLSGLRGDREGISTTRR